MTDKTFINYILINNGDVIDILDEAGVQVASYSYDEWGKVLSVTGSDAEGIGQLNPIRYRGYYYDWETGFYYLNSRYYDPEVGRFINSDSIASASGEKIKGLNLFAYCGNNPINMCDSSRMCYGLLDCLRASCPKSKNYIAFPEKNVLLNTNYNQGVKAQPYTLVVGSLNMWIWRWHFVGLVK